MTRRATGPICPEARAALFRRCMEKGGRDELVAVCTDHLAAMHTTPRGQLPSEPQARLDAMRRAEATCATATPDPLCCPRLTPQAACASVRLSEILPLMW